MSTNLISIYATIYNVLSTIKPIRQFYNRTT